MEAAYFVGSELRPFYRILLLSCGVDIDTIVVNWDSVQANRCQERTGGVSRTTT
ncbi:hypothetical protein PHYBLDRAFT_158477 [Phycomyces blakesleeanus NRRL 1555(-)]|uniref:Uncharacterized protein n=1 Tax=Phycomyces blakesleeanus (strain ATCC 8743b / DSM 1359 / FGSC 10004 / NBRC 33097 / NRRL 1555) TaxID=763407 RepID=A0A162NJ10_PHYB8|nr:hypothetical protein PHYBLDRAFT_158477 [Phycomyces blakesleeanus NRRL 1555(-)]OAD74678.1 hypothetical protein PHYBLDRAFT_158477 [Phycomyces blakesleeanus NRRL 1555(-)]|eukprot:XP_018292718.1 hypothetical protein PHYBLDRAFT_158477 [Phycomyces blakesleeanus NRRL 1555(-)]